VDAFGESSNNQLKGDRLVGNAPQGTFMPVWVLLKSSERQLSWFFEKWKWIEGAQRWSIWDYQPTVDLQ
jgi:hypothetical protein